MKKLFIIIILISSILVLLFFQKLEKNNEIISQNINTENSKKKDRTTSLKPSQKLIIGAKNTKNTLLIQELKKLANCQSQDNCPFEDSDPRAIHFAVGDAISQKLQQAKQQVNANEAALLIQQFMSFDNEAVRLATLELMASHPPQDENVNLIIKGLKWSTDPSVYQAAMMEFARYQDTHLQQQIDQFLLKTIQLGPVFARRMVAQQLLPFLNQQNITAYQTLASQLTANSAEAKLLNAVILEYQQGLQH